MNATKPAPANAQAKLLAMSTSQLVECFTLTDSRMSDPSIPMVRGWIMDELESREPKRFQNWINDEGGKSIEAFF